MGSPYPQSMDKEKVVEDEGGGEEIIFCILNLPKCWKSMKLNGRMESHCVYIFVFVYIIISG